MTDPVHELIAAEFDPQFYQSQLGAPVADPLGHFMTTGWRAGLDPSPAFSTRFYLGRSPDVRRAGANPFHHYLGWGRREGRAPTPEAAAAEKREQGDVEQTIAAGLDPDFYLQTNPELAESHVDPVLHYIAFGHDAGLNPSPTFDTRFYLTRSPDVAEARINGFFHYLKWGRHEGRAASAGDVERATSPASPEEALLARHVDADFYEAQHPEIARNHVTAFKHYLHFGWRQDFDPSPRFSTAFYRATPYDAAEEENPLLHYLLFGRVRGRLPRPLLPRGVDHARGEAVERVLRPHFEPEFYLAAHPGMVAAGVDPLQDYLDEGWRAGRDPNPWFATGEYLARFPEVAAMGVNPLLHYLLWGREQGFPPARGDGVAAVLDPEAELGPAEVRPLALPAAHPEPLARVDPRRLNIHWVIPEIEGPGRGGHMTLFRIVRWLEAFGHRCTLWVNDPNPAWTDEARRDLIERRYQSISAEVQALREAPEFPSDAIVFATSWTTALVVNATPSARARFYLVQDDERAFHPAGSRTFAAARTYELDMAYICAGPWLAEMLQREHGRWARAFDLAPDERQHAPAKRGGNARPRIAFYARTHTERRAVDLGLLALKLLAEAGVEFEAHLFGSETPLPSAPFPVVNHGVLDAETLAELYGACDLGVCFSATNHSLIPQEMMACGLPVLELDAPSTRTVFPPEVITLAAPTPDQIAAALKGMLQGPEGRRVQADRAQAWVSKRSWEASARAVEAAILERLVALGIEFEPVPTAAVTREGPLASVLIPTLNGGEGLRRVLDRVLEQQAAWPFEVVVIDSQSDDGTWELLQSYAEVRAISIPREQFQHGRTRNLLAAEAKGEFLAFLTQDAEPADRLWLGDLIGSLQRHPRAAGAFGRHLPRPEASPFTKRDLNGFFRYQGGQPIERSKFLDLERWLSGDRAFRRDLHFFSNNNSCLRRSVWRRLPLPEVEYGEDQVWAARVIAERYAIVYSPTACVIHSHDYDPASRYERSRVEGRWFRQSFGYEMGPADPGGRVAEMNAGDERWGVRNGASAEEIALKKELNAAEIAGLIAGQRDA